ncbi:MAG: FAD:protein FMN transferase [Candidatus Caldatribacteriaceae bacterium]
MSFLRKFSSLRPLKKWFPLAGIFPLLFLFHLGANPVERTFFGFDTFITVRLPQRHARHFEAIESLIYRYDHLWNRFSPDSLIFRINTSSSWVEVDDATFYLLEEAVSLSQDTEGMFCPLVGGLMDLWGFTARPKVPEPSEITEELRRIRESTIMFDEGRRAVLLFGGAKLDLGGIAKGYLVDLIAHFLKEQGVEWFLINAGGTVLGEGRTWSVGILRPQGEGLMGKVVVEGLCVSTSADSFRFFEENGKHYHHILNPFTGYPGSVFRSVTVVAQSGLLADVLSTAIMAGDSSFLERILRRFPGVFVFALQRDGKICMYPKEQSIFEVVDEK